jgi:GT2 family glycosyltransferase
VPEPPVWAVVVNWNGRDFVGPCLRTLLGSSYGNLSVALMDNASSDGSADMVESEFPAVRVVRNSENRGYAAAANDGIRLAISEGAEFVLVLNNDIEIDEGAVGAMVSAALERPRAAFVGPLIYYADRPDVIWSAGGRVSYWTGDIRHIGIREEDRGQYGEVTEVDYLTGCALLASAGAVSEIGLMDESYFMYNEDTDWCARARERGYSVLLAPSAKLWHKVSMSSGGGLTPFKIYNRIRSTLRFFRLHARPFHWMGILPLTAARMVGFMVGQLAGGGGANARAVARGVFDSMLGRERTRGND